MPEIVDGKNVRLAGARAAHGSMPRRRESCRRCSEPAPLDQPLTSLTHPLPPPPPPQPQVLDFVDPDIDARLEALEREEEALAAAAEQAVSERQRLGTPGLLGRSAVWCGVLWAGARGGGSVVCCSGRGGGFSLCCPALSPGAAAGPGSFAAHTPAAHRPPRALYPCLLLCACRCRAAARGSCRRARPPRCTKSGPAKRRLWRVSGPDSACCPLPLRLLLLPAAARHLLHHLLRRLAHLPAPSHLPAHPPPSSVAAQEERGQQRGAAAARPGRGAVAHQGAHAQRAGGPGPGRK